MFGSSVIPIASRLPRGKAFAVGCQGERNFGLVRALTVVVIATARPLAALGALVSGSQQGDLVLATSFLTPIVKVSVGALAGRRVIAGGKWQPRRVG
jgi:hypothetical protein